LAFSAIVEPGDARGMERAPERRGVERRMSLEREGMSGYIGIRIRFRFEGLAY
jgi:hypothetical protein